MCLDGYEVQPFKMQRTSPEVPELVRSQEKFHMKHLDPILLAFVIYPQF